MSKHRALVYGQPVPQDFFDALQEFIGTMGSPNLDLTMVAGSANQVQIVAGTASAQVGLAIDGLWRYISATITTTVTGAAGTYDIFVTTGNNSFSVNPSPPPPELDATNYGFVFNTPLIQGNVPAAPHYRKVGECVFDGTRILSLRQTIDIDSSQGFQPGDLKLSAVASPQAGWLACQGQAVSRTTYAALYAALGGTGSPWGQGDGSTTFNVPDLRSRVPVGAGQGGGLTNRALGAYGGGTLDLASPKLAEETHVLALTEIPSHNHGGATGSATTGTDSPDHSHNDGGHGHAQPPGMSAWTCSTPSGSPPGRLQYTASGGLPIDSGYGTATAYASISGATARHAHSVPALSISSQGGGAAHNSMQPYSAVSYFIKT